jgi:hypothetical protein
LKGPAIAGFRFSLVGRNIYIVILRSRRNQKGIIEKKLEQLRKNRAEIMAAPRLFVSGPLHQYEPTLLPLRG